MVLNCSNRYKKVYPLLDKIETLLSAWMIYNDSPTDSLQPWLQDQGGSGGLPWSRMCQESNRGRASHSCHV